jgi:ubiquinone/menaquinone biosynthesis C-methylase UbiE
LSWTEEAENWIAWVRAGDDGYTGYNASFFELLPPAAGRTIELGCGEGRVSRDLRARGYDVVGIDAVPRLVEAAVEADPGGEYLVADAAALPFPDESFDLAVAYNSLMDMDDMDGAVREARRVLRPGSRFCVCVTHFVNDAGRFEPDSADGAFYVDAYRGKRPYDEVWERAGVAMRFVGWCYPLESYTRALEDAGFLIEAIREPVPSAERLAEKPRAARRLRIPNFLMLRALKPA